MLSSLHRHWQVYLAARFLERNNPPSPRLPHETAFLPAVLEITDSPPSPAGRWTNYTLMILFLGALIWSCVGEVDMVAVAQGRIIPSGRVKKVQPLDPGIVREILVQEGSFVRQGDPLIRLDATESHADTERLKGEWQEARAELARWEALSQDPPRRDYAAPEGISPETAKRHKHLLESQWSQHLAQLAALEAERSQQQARLRAIEVEIRKLEAILPLVSERAKAKEILAKQGNAARMDHLTLEQERIAAEEDLRGKRHNREETLAAIETVLRRRKQLETQFAQTAWEKVVDAERQTAVLQREVEKALQRWERCLLTAPEEGIVQQLQVHTPGGVVTQAQELMWIVPSREGVEVEAMVLNKDVGFVHPGDEVVLKVETFNFTRYGTVSGKVRHLSRDAVEKEQVGLVYPVRVKMDREVIQVEGEAVRLSPGMAVVAEISSGKRPLIAYLLSPILKTLKEGFQEK
ncbi:MAG: HlyD family type I secretion periplasmic adaptor subunit [Magnetococcales bacterium]|nr:HlyD family type I secretion periplasmic adaptor subunit [Magnetococcales bacterium]